LAAASYINITRNSGAALAVARAIARHALTFIQRIDGRAHRFAAAIAPYPNTRKTL